jgi:hypothetical protein
MSERKKENKPGAGRALQGGRAVHTSDAPLLAGSVQHNPEKERISAQLYVRTTARAVGAGRRGLNNSNSTPPPHLRMQAGKSASGRKRAG